MVRIFFAWRGRGKGLLSGSRIENIIIKLSLKLKEIYEAGDAEVDLLFLRFFS